MTDAVPTWTMTICAACDGPLYECRDNRHKRTKSIEVVPASALKYAEKTVETLDTQLDKSLEREAQLEKGSAEYYAGLYDEVRAERDRLLKRIKALTTDAPKSDEPHNPRGAEEEVFPSDNQ